MPRRFTKPASGNRFRWRKRVLRPDEAVRFIDAVGFCMLFPVKEVPLPSLYYAMSHHDAGLDFEWDRCSEMLWKWKSSLPKRKLVFYAKYFRGRGTFISLGHLPNFLAMRQTAVAPGDYGRFYRAGRISLDARTIWEALFNLGSLATLELRNVCKMDTLAGNKRFKRAMAELQGLLIVVHFGIEQEIASWPSGKFELTCRAFPAAIAAARVTDLAGARRSLAAKFMEVSPGAAPEVVARLFGWSKDEAITALGPVPPPVDTPIARAAANL